MSRLEAIAASPSEEIGPDSSEKLRRSWLLSGLPDDLADRIISNEPFLRYGGKFALGLPPLSDTAKLTEADSFLSPLQDLRERERTKAHVLGNLLSGNEAMRRKADEQFRIFGTVDPNTLGESEAAILLDLYTRLHRGLQETVGSGKTIEEIAARFIRPCARGIEERLAVGMEVERYYRVDENTWIPFRRNVTTWSDFLQQSATMVRRRKGFKTKFKAKVRAWDYRNGAYAKDTLVTLHRDRLDEVARLIESGHFPFVNYHETREREDIRYGVDLSRTTAKQDRDLARTGEGCGKSCKYYHQNTEQMKEKELIAPVVGELFGRVVFEQYQAWKKSPDGTFRILIPAQADETTFSGILAYLKKQGVSKKEIRQNFFFELSDLCPTPLMKLKGEVKAQRLSKNARITSTDVFAWGRKEEKYDVILADYFLDLFPKDGPATQKNVLASLEGALAPGGKLLLTTRCGTSEKPVSQQTVMAAFYETVEGKIRELVGQLEAYSGEDPEDAAATSRDSSLLVSLLTYRQLREVHPFANEEVLWSLLGRVEGKHSMTYTMDRIGDGKVALEITRDKKDRETVIEWREKEAVVTLSEAACRAVRCGYLGSFFRLPPLSETIISGKQARITFDVDPGYRSKSTERMTEQELLLPHPNRTLIRRLAMLLGKKGLPVNELDFSKRSFSRAGTIWSA